MTIPINIRKHWGPYQFFIRREVFDRFECQISTQKSPFRIMLLSDYVVDKRGKLVKSRSSRTHKRLTAKDIRSFEGEIINNIN